MVKIISLFQRNYDWGRLVRDEVVPGAEWVIAGEGMATQKLDGTCCLYEDGKLWKRHTLKKGKRVPDGFRPATEVDPTTGKQQGWVAVEPTDKYHTEAFEQFLFGPLIEGTYELVGPKVQGNPEDWSCHTLFRHGATLLDDVPRTYDGLNAYFEGKNIEGIVWHHPDGRMVKIKARDFGFARSNHAH